MAKEKVADTQTLEQWWAEDAARLNQFAESLQSVAVETPERESRDFSEWETLVDEEYRAFCPGVSPPDNSCPPSNKGDGSRVQNAGRRVKFGTIARVALANLRETGGFSVHPVTAGSPTTGYMVSVKPEAEVVYNSVAQVNEAAFRDFYRANKATFKANPNLHFGGWVDTNTGKVYFDLSARYDNVREAVDAAKATNQLAIWHLDAGKEIRQEDYDARWKQGRSAKEARAVRLPARSGRRGRRAGLQGDGGGVPGVRPKGDGWQAGRPATIGGWQHARPVIGRAFCPGVSPPDNSCSPANKGTGRQVSAIARPEPDWDASVTTGHGDPRGALTGHSEAQRQEYAAATTQWMADRGIELSIASDDKGPPTVDSMHAVMRGVEAAERLGIEVPEKIFVRSIGLQGGVAAFNINTGEVSISPDLSSEKLLRHIENGWNAGDPGNPDAAPLVHELFHRDHMDSTRGSYGKGNPDYAKEAAVNDFRNWTGRLRETPAGVRPTVDPWSPDYRKNFYAMSDGKRVSGDDAHEIAFSVSRYAATNPVEFVAEVRTAMAGGRKFPKSVMNLYQDYLGPPIPAGDSSMAEAA